jgi:hypothetical protein
VIINAQPNPFLNSSTMPDAYRYLTRNLPAQHGYDGYFESHQTLRHLPCEDTALAVLRRCAYIVAPVMRRHGWSVPLLNELPMDSPDLGSMATVRLTKQVKSMGLSRKVKDAGSLHINVRLRHHEVPDMFVAIKVVVQTLLHELAHLNHTHHNLGFFWRNLRLLRELERDVAERKVKVSGREIPKQIVQPGEIPGLKGFLIASSS